MGNDSSIRQFAVLASKKVQHDENKKKKGPSAEIPKEQMDGVINAIAIHDEPACRVARRAGIGINPLVSDLVDALIEWGTEQYENGFEAGRGPNPPAAPLRPVLMRRAA